MSERDLATAFEREFKAFLKNLIKVFPNDREMKMLSSTINIALMDDYEHKVIRSFYDILMPFDALIQARDPQFFYQCKTEVQEFQLFSKLNVYWEQLDEDNKKVVWDYLSVLYTLAKRFSA